MASLIRADCFQCFLGQTRWRAQRDRLWVRCCSLPDNYVRLSRRNSIDQTHVCSRVKTTTPSIRETCVNIMISAFETIERRCDSAKHSVHQIEVESRRQEQTMASSRTANQHGERHRWRPTVCDESELECNSSRSCFFLEDRCSFRVTTRVRVRTTLHSRALIECAVVVSSLSHSSTSTMLSK